MTTPETPNCPNCGSAMIQRTARRGDRSGRPFWGCRRYPACRGIVEIEPGGWSEAVSVGAFPRRLVAQPLDQAGQCAFFQIIALPAEWVQQVFLEGVDQSLLRTLAQWRLDYPTLQKYSAPTSDLTLIAVAEAILTRGTTPLCSPALESLLGLADSSYSVTEIVDAVRHAVRGPVARLRPNGFDSPEEGLLFSRLAALWEKAGQPWLPVPQVQLASITDAIEPASSERGDFLFLHPDHTPILVEVDGAQHLAHAERDARRDRAIQAAGVRVVRVPAQEIRDGFGPAWERLEELIRADPVEQPVGSKLIDIVRWCKLFSQVQLALLVALRTGWIRVDGDWRIGVALPAPFRADTRALPILDLAAAELAEILTRLARMQGHSEFPGRPHIVVFNDDAPADDLDLVIGPADGRWIAPLGTPAFRVSDLGWPHNLPGPLTATPPARSMTPRREDARWFLQYIFRKDDFREGQWETIERTLRGEDSVVLLPTGAGKSIAFQLAALLRPGRCIVVDPIVSLIEDQIDNLARIGIDRTIGITSQLSTRERGQALEAFRSGHYLFSYVAPERFQTEPFREALQTLTMLAPISEVAIDEAHCVSEWGHDFRTAYLNLGRLARTFCASEGVTPPLVALTGTASKMVLKDVQRELGITAFDAIITPTSFDRPELRYRVVAGSSIEKDARLQGFLERLPTEFGVDRSVFFAPRGTETQAGLIFCPHVNGEFGTHQRAQQLARGLTTRVDDYSGQAPKAVDSAAWDERKRQAARDFKRNRTALMACTNAFGMGIDKPNIRYTVHLGLPPSIEAFYQEAGRAGRDGHRAECAIILSDDRPDRSQFLLSPTTAHDQLDEAMQNVSRAEADDITRALYFHLGSFRGQKQDADDIETLLDQIGDIDITEAHRVNVTWDDGRWHSDRGLDGSHQRLEKALHRLVLLGVVEDYTVRYASREIGVSVRGATREEIAEAFGRYVGAYQRRLGEETARWVRRQQHRTHRAFVQTVAKALIQFIYQHVELARRRALQEMLEAATSAVRGGDLRERILAYLEQSDWDNRLDAVRDSARGGLDALGAVIDDLVTPRDAVDLRAAAGRALVSFPDVPGLLILRGLAEILCPDGHQNVAGQDLAAAVDFARGTYRLETPEIAAAVGRAVTCAASKPGAAESLVAAVLTTTPPDQDLPRGLVREVPETVAGLPAWWLLNRLVDRCAGLHPIPGDS